MAQQGVGVYGIVLAGGRSRRMQGPDKALANLDGRTLTAHVVARLAPQCGGLVLSYNGGSERFEAFGLPVVADGVPGFAGPLAGILAALDWIAAHHAKTAHAVSCAVDTPFVPLDVVNRLQAAAQREGMPLACATSGGRRHPVATLWPVEARHALRHALLDRQERRVGAVLDELGCAEADWPCEPFDPFFNVNTPDDLEEAHSLMRSPCAVSPHRTG